MILCLQRATCFGPKRPSSDVV